MPASAIEVSFCGAATTASTSPAKRGLDRGCAQKRSRRGRHLHCVIPNATSAAPDCGHASTLSHGPGQSASPSRCTTSQLGFDATGVRVLLEHGRIAHDDRVARRVNAGVERRLDADLWPDAAGIAGGNGDPGFRPFPRHSFGRETTHSHGISEAWITSGTPWPPTDLMARSTSFSPNLWVVIFSSGKRRDASCASASSQAR